MSICSPLRYRESEGVPDVNLPLLPALLLALEIPHGNVKQRWRGTQDFSSASFLFSLLQGSIFNADCRSYKPFWWLPFRPVFREQGGH